MPLARIRKITKALSKSGSSARQNSRPDLGLTCLKFDNALKQKRATHRVAPTRSAAMVKSLA